GLHAYDCESGPDETAINRPYSSSRTRLQRALTTEAGLARQRRPPPRSARGRSGGGPREEPCPRALSPGARCDGPTSTSACWPTVLPSGIVALRGRLTHGPRSPAARRA